DVAGLEIAARGVVRKAREQRRELLLGNPRRVSLLGFRREVARAVSLGGRDQLGHRPSLRLLVFTDDPELELRDHTSGEPDGHFVLAERLDRLIELDPTMVDIDVRLLELIRDVAARDRAEQLL